MKSTDTCKPLFVLGEDRVIVVSMNADDDELDCAKVEPFWKDKNIILGSDLKRMFSVCISVILYTFGIWTLTAELDMETHEMRCRRRLLNSLHRNQYTTKEV